jgi:hypothetical protein
MFLVGISFWIAYKNKSIYDGRGILTTQAVEHNWYTILIMIVGIILLALSLFPLIISIIFN